MRQFEIPYNFDKNLVTILSLLNTAADNIYCFYCPAFKEDYTPVYREKVSSQIIELQTRKTYEQHVQYINEKFPNKIQLLLQRADLLMPEEKIQYYTTLGINKFCVSSLDQARLIKQINPSAEIVLSILARFEEKDIISHLDYKEYFNGIVLWFPFNRDLNRIKQLPKDFFYILIVNGECSILCDGIHHWSSKDPTGESIICTRDKNPKSFKTQITMRPQDLLLFDDYIKIYKLQDRSWPTYKIIQDFMIYNKDNWNREFLYYDMSPNEQLYT